MGRGQDEHIVRRIFEGCLQILAETDSFGNGIHNQGIVTFHFKFDSVDLIGDI